MDPNYPKRQICNVAFVPNTLGLITQTIYTFWILNLTKMGYQTGRIGVRIVTMWDNGVISIRSIEIFMESCE